MTEVHFVDQTIRDGPQSLWGMRLRGGMLTAVAEDIRKAGYRAVEVPGGSYFTVQLRYLREDPLEVIDWFRACLPGVSLRTGRRPTSTGEYGVSSRSILDFYSEVMARHGIDSFWIYDCLYNMPEMERTCRVTHASGMEVVPALMYGISPAHTDEFYADKVRQMVSWGVASSIHFEDAPGILTPERASTLIPALVQAAGDVPIEMHCHNTTGLAPLNYLEGLKHGVHVIHTASRPVANGPSLPSTEKMLVNLEAAGHTHTLDTEGFERIAAHFERVALQEGHPLGAPNEYDAAVYEHQLPGGMTGTFKAQLAQHGMEDSLDAVLAEIPRVRAELGHPVSATPFSQLIGTQAVLNVVSGERYSITLDEIALYVQGHYGDTPMPIDPDVKDRVLSTPRGQALLDWERPDEPLEAFRERYGGSQLTDDELLCRHFAPPEDVQATRDAGAMARGYDFETDLALVLDQALAVSRPARVSISLDGLSIDLIRDGGKAGA